MLLHRPKAHQDILGRGPHQAAWPKQLEKDERPLVGNLRTEFILKCLFLCVSLRLNAFGSFAVQFPVQLLFCGDLPQRLSRAQSGGLILVSACCLEAAESRLLNRERC